MAGVYSKSEVKGPDLQMTCCLGDHPLKNPKLLPCQHSFCSGCLKTEVGQDKNFTCPKCHLAIPLTEKDIDKLQEDVLFQMMQKNKNKTADCDFCKAEDKKVPGTFQCLDCGEVTCDHCKEVHTKTMMTRSHKLVPVKDVYNGKYKKELETAMAPICPKHSKPNTVMQFLYYCEDCKCLACQICVYEEHKPKGHICRSIEETHGDKVTAVTEHLTKLLDLNQLDEEFAVVLEQSQGQNKELQEKLENEVHERAANLMDIIEKVKQNKLTEIKGHFEKKESLFQVKLDETKNRIIRTGSIVGYTKTFLEHSDKTEFLQHEHEIIKKMKDQMQDKTEKSLKVNVLEIGPPRINQAETSITEAFGELTVSTKTFEHKQDARKWMKEPKVLFSVDSGIGYTWDLTVTENEDIVAVCDSTIQVYNSEGTPKERINCSQIKDAWNVVAKGDTLYVSNDDSSGNVFVIDFKGNVKKTITLPETSQSHRLKGLAVDDEGNVYISPFGIHTIYKCKPDETKAQVFIPQGTHPDLKGPVFLDMTPGGDLVVSNNQSKTIQVYNRHGEFSWQYKGQGHMTLNSTYGVCCDSDGYIYISDRNKHRVQVIRYGEVQGCVKMEGFTYPNGINLDKDGNILCGFDNGQTMTKIKVWE